MLEKTACDLSDEKLKIAFRMAYSLFDKIAFFLKKYFRLPVSEQRVNFRTLWYPSVRNHLEHNYLLIQDDALYASSGKSGLRGLMTDPFM